MSSHKMVWKEGMLLMPQHFQQNDRHYDYQLKARTQLMSRYGWGLFTLEIDEHYFNTRKIVISKASGVLPDGSLFELGHDTQALVLDVPKNTHNVPVYLALPLVTGNHIETRDVKHQDVLARYLAHDLKIADSFAEGLSVCDASCAKPDFRLLLGEQPNDQHFVKIKICQVIAPNGTDGIALDKEFIATHLHFNAHSELQAFLKEVLSLLGNRGDKLAARIRSSGQVGGAEVGDFMMLQLINRYELLLRHSLRTDQAHPEEVYLVLLGLLGELTTFASDDKRPDMALQYEHSDQGACLRQLTDAIRQVLSMVLEQHAIKLELQQAKYNIQVSPIKDPTLLDSSYFVLAASAQCDTEELRTRLPAHLKAGTVESIRQLVNLHLPGIKVSPLAVAPRQIPFHANKSYFTLEFSEQEVADLKRSGGFAFHISGEFTGLELDFWAIRN
ncbi:type VI secretion system baseplate subunit TssK [Pseudomonas sp. D47]|uniref:type VI secretion system baseplate subunit TssK n=1 Tax=Pseudomonas sp. D47 TaxID=3159447 RepID=UPI00387B939D